MLFDAALLPLHYKGLRQKTSSSTDQEGFWSSLLYSCVMLACKRGMLIGTSCKMHWFQANKTYSLILGAISAFTEWFSLCVLFPQSSFRISRSQSWQKPCSSRSGSKRGAREHVAPKVPSIFYKHNTTSSCTILQLCGHYGRPNVPFKRLALLGLYYFPT